MMKYSSRDEIRESFGPKNALYHKLIGKQVIVRRCGAGLHLFTECSLVQDSVPNDPYYITILKEGMTNKGHSKLFPDKVEEYILYVLNVMQCIKKCTKET